MRWKDISIPDEGEIRVIKKYLFFPRKIDGEWRWFEWVKIRQKYYINWIGLWSEWEDIEWIDEEK